MNENNSERIERVEKIKDDKEMIDIVEKIIKLKHQIEHPDRNGMIEALQDAQQIAFDDIIQSIHQQSGGVYSKAWSDFSDSELYHMLPQYHQGLINHGIAKIGKGRLEQMIKTVIKNTLKL